MSTFENYFKIESSKQVRSTLAVINSGLEEPYLAVKIAEILSDGNMVGNMISDKEKLNTGNFLCNYHRVCWNLFTDAEDMTRLENGIKYAKREIYKVEAPMGIRYATVKEIAMGVQQLIGEIQYPVGEDTYKLLNILYWSLTGKISYFREAGYKLTYDVATKGYKESFYEMLLMSYKQIVEACNLYTDYARFDAVLNTLYKVKKSEFKYANYADDEIDETLSIKQLIYNIDVTFPRNSDNHNYRRAIAIVIRGKKSIKSLSPLEVSFLRKMYSENAKRKNDKQNNEKNIEIESMCELLLNERYKGKISQDHFVYKIIDTLKKNRYTKCSSKQYSILENAYKIIADDSNNDSNNVNNVENKIPIIDDLLIDKSLTRMITGEDMLDINNAICNDSFFEDIDA